MTTPQEHERKLVTSFILPARQSHYLELFDRPHRRKDITRSLAHFKDVDERYAVTIKPSEENPTDILRILKAKGAPETCYTVSEDSDLDGKEIPLADALREIIGGGMGTFLSCLPGRLAYFEDEDCRWILERRR
jgi:hypothetical protein